MRSPGGGPEGSEADDHISRLVEQEVDKRLFQEKIMRAESGEFKRMPRKKVSIAKVMNSKGFGFVSITG